MENLYSQSEIEAIASALADTSEGLTGSEIGHLLATLGIADTDPSITKRKRLANAFIARQNYSQNRRAINEFIRQALKPERYVKCQERFETLRANVNGALAFCGLAVNEEGMIIAIDRVKTITEAQRRAAELRADLTARGVHPDVLSFCRVELVADDYFHAVLEAAKSIADRLRSKASVAGDGSTLVDATLCGPTPKLAINDLKTDSQRSEQSGFANLVKGVFGMFRNPTAHEARILWSMSKEDAEDVLSIVSLIHRRLDKARYIPQ